MLECVGEHDGNRLSDVPHGVTRFQQQLLRAAERAHPVLARGREIGGRHDAHDARHRCITTRNTNAYTTRALGTRGQLVLSPAAAVTSTAVIVPVACVVIASAPKSDPGRMV